MMDIKERIQIDGGEVIRNFLHERLVSIIVGRFWEIEFFPGPLGVGDELPDGDRTGRIYESARNSMQYGYLPLKGIHGLYELNAVIMHKIIIESGLIVDNFSDLNYMSIPIFLYESGGHIKPHRDRDMFEPDKTPGWLYIVGLTRNTDYEGGAVCWKLHDEVYDQGRRVENLDTDRCMKARLGMGDMLVLDNSRTVHWVESVKYGTRMTTGYRSKGI